MSTSVASYSAMVEHCTKYGWAPVNIKDEEENSQIYLKYRTTHPDISGYWLAQNDQVSENVWTYNDESNCHGVFLNFDQANVQPDGGESNNCLVMGVLDGGRWQDVSCHDNFGIICKRTQQPLTIPTTKSPTTKPPTTILPTTKPPTTTLPTTKPPTTTLPTTKPPTTTLPTTKPPTTSLPTTKPPTTTLPTTKPPTTTLPTTKPPTTTLPTTKPPTTTLPTTKPSTTTKDTCNGLKCVLQGFILDQDDVIISSTSPRLSTHNVNSKLRCAKECTRTVECSSFTFEAAGTLCELFGTVIDQTQFSVKSGSKYFIRG
ncbi:uncharacterized protein [Amphiura filiformis]|uniref:uncharacterized protein n=1 Tax=Amphiura filiformis TaxID=82378 RepID=UPI003B211766